MSAKSCGNKMALNTSKTKVMIFRTHGKPINEIDCQLVYNSTLIGREIDPLLMTPIERVPYFQFAFQFAYKPPIHIIIQTTILLKQSKKICQS